MGDKNFSVVGIRKQAMTMSSLQQNINAYFIACELFVKRVDILGRYCIVTNGPKISLCTLLNCRLVVLLSIKIRCFDFFLKYNKVIRI